MEIVMNTMKYNRNRFNIDSLKCYDLGDFNKLFILTHNLIIN